MKFKERFKELLFENNINVLSLSKLLDIEYVSIYSYLKGSYPNIENAVKIANFFNCTLNYLFCLDIYPDEYNFKTTYSIEIFFDKYKQALVNNNMTHYYVSKTLNFGNSSFKNWQKGSVPKIETLIKLSNLFNLTLDYWIDREK